MYQKYTKQLASGNTLKKDSWLHSSVKSNFVKQSILSVHERCSETLSKDKVTQSEKQCLNTLKANGYSEKDFVMAKRPTRKNNKDNTDKCVLKLPYISDSLVRKINYLIRKHRLNVRFVSCGNKKLRNVLKTKSTIKKHDNCKVCNQLPEKFNCEKTCVVYQFTCNKCNAKYIGKTSRPFYVRHNEHYNSIKNKNSASALSDHTKICDVSSIEDFSVEYLRCLNDSVETSLVESRLINLHKPNMNWRHETAGAVLLQVEKCTSHSEVHY